MMYRRLHGFYKSDASIIQNNNPGWPILRMKHEDDWTVHPRRVGGSEFTRKERSAEQHRFEAQPEY